MYKLLENYLFERKQRVVLNGQTSNWADINAGVPQGSVLGPLLFLIYINGLPEGLKSNVKLFADDTSIFSVVNDINVSCTELNEDLSKINRWAYPWKMSFNPDPNKSATEVIFTHKLKKPPHPAIHFNNLPISLKPSTKHLGMILDEKLNFNAHIDEKICKANKGIGLIKKMSLDLPRKTLIDIYKSLVRPHLDYGDVIYDQPNNKNFVNKLESIQYNAALAITGAIKGTSKERLFGELGFESLSKRRWYRRMCMFWKIVNNTAPLYLTKLLPNKQYSRTQVGKTFIIASLGTQIIMQTLFFLIYRSWNVLDSKTKNIQSFTLQKSFIKNY